jgi:hypothetical protein
MGAAGGQWRAGPMPAARAVPSLWLDFGEAGMETTQNPETVATRQAWNPPEQRISRQIGQRWPAVAAALGMSAAALGARQLASGNKRPLTRLIREGGLLLAGASWAYLLLLRRWHLRWGATDEEIRRPMPADELVPRPHIETTRALTIEAPPEAVWPWLVQMGYHRGGWYSYDWLDNLGVPSARRIISELQNLKVGDKLAPMEGAFIVAALDPPRSMVLVSRNKQGHIAMSWTFLLEPLPGGRTRFIERIRGRYDINLAGLLLYVAIEPADFVMMRKQMLNLKRRAEQNFRGYS